SFGPVRTARRPGPRTRRSRRLTWPTALSIAYALLAPEVVKRPAPGPRPRRDPTGAWPASPVPSTARARRRAGRRARRRRLLRRPGAAAATRLDARHDPRP